MSAALGGARPLPGVVAMITPPRKSRRRLSKVGPLAIAGLSGRRFRPLNWCRRPTRICRGGCNFVAGCWRLRRRPN